jgi:hypothetical protein
MAFWSLSKPPQTQPVEPAATMDAVMLKTELGHAYERGRSEERARRPARGLIATVLVVLSAAGVLFMALAARDGSFTSAGGDIDRTIAQAMSQIKV